MALDRYSGWREIADYLSIDPRTAQRYEESRGLPVRRLPHGGPKSPVFAIRSELDAWMEANIPATKSPALRLGYEAPSLAGPVLDRISKLSHLAVYRRNYFLRLVLRRSREGVRVHLECRYELCNATNERQPFVQEITIDDSDRGYMEEMSFFADKKPVYVLKRLRVTERPVGYSIYHGPKMSLERDSKRVQYECRASWIINRSENSLFCNHMVLPTIGIIVETHAPPEFTITPSFTTRDLVMTGEHVDIAWNLRA